MHAGDDALRGIGLAFRDGVISTRGKGRCRCRSIPRSRITRSRVRFEDDVSPPRFSTGYFLLRNRLAMLVETLWKPYPQRVQATRNTIVSVLERIARHGRDWTEAARAAMRDRPGWHARAVVVQGHR